jgi:hypothetical protein
LEVSVKAFTDYRRFFWLGGIAALVLGFIVLAVVLPTTSDPLKGLGPAVSVPKMQNVPAPSDRVKLEVDEKQR